MPNIPYTFTNKNSVIYDDIGVELFCLFNLSNNINNKQPIKMNGKYFPVKYNMAYPHLMLDFIGPYIYLKKKIPDLKLIFFKFNDFPNKVCDDLINFFDAKVINIKNHNYIFDEFYFFYTGDIRKSFPEEMQKNTEVNFFMSPIPSDLFLDSYYEIDFNTDIHDKYMEVSIKELCNTFYSKRVGDIENKIYISRTKDLTRTDPYSTTEYFNKNRQISKQLLESIDKIMQDNGYKIIFAEDLGFFEQLNIFYNAKTIATLEGSSLLNCIWCKNDTKILKIVASDNYKKLKYPLNKFIQYNSKNNIHTIDIIKLNNIQAIEKIVNYL